MPIALKCSGCSRNIKAPDSAAGKRVKCPGCGTILSVGAAAVSGRAAASPKSTKAGQAGTAARRTGPTTDVSRRQAVASAPAASSFAPAGGGFEGFDDDLLTDSDFNVQTMGPGRKPASSSTEIPQAPKKTKRNKAFYWAPGVSAIGAASLNIVIFLGCLGFLIWAMVVLVRAEVAGAGILLYPILHLSVFGFFVAGGNIHAIIAGLNLVTLRGRTASAVAIGELFGTPIAFAIYCWFNIGWLAGVIFGVGMALYNFPIAGWVAFAISGEQAKIDFDEYDGDELDSLAQELQNRARSKGGH